VKRPRWIHRSTLLLLHAETLAEHGGRTGMRDEGAFESAIARPRNIYEYETKADLARLAAAYGFGIVRNHPFIDGNKRVGFAAIGLFLAINGQELDIDQVEAVATIMSVTAGTMRESALTAWIREHVKRPRRNS